MTSQEWEDAVTFHLHRELLLKPSPSLSWVLFLVPAPHLNSTFCLVLRFTLSSGGFGKTD